MKLRKLTLTAVLTAAALVMFVLENQLPPLTAIPGIKPGLSNIFTLFAMQALGPGWALGVLLVRVTLGCVITGQGMALLYSLTGGLFAYIGMLALRRWFSGRRLWILSVFCAMAHNFGQLRGGAHCADARCMVLPAGLTAGCNSCRCSDRALHAAASAAAGQGRAAAGRQEARGGSKRMRLHIHGVHVPNRKNTAELAALRLPIPETVEIPMSMHIGAPAIPVVKPGDSVRVGQLIGKAGGFVSAPVYASVSGTVKKIGQQVGSGGRLMQTVVIAADGKQEPDPELQPPKLETMQDFLDAVRASGMVGLGGAGFPTVVKLTVKNLEQVQAVIINGAECEPYITSDTRTMLDRSDELMEGARLVQHFLQVRRVIFAIEDNKPRCIQLYRKLTKDEDGMEVCALKSLYPQGGEKVLIYNTIGQIVPEGKLPLDVGAIVLNCTTLANIARYCNTGMPLVEKCITVDGSAVAKPKNVIVPIGMKLADVFEQSGGFCQEPKKVLYGGPMMGIAVPDLEQPVLKNTNAVLAMSEADAVLPEPTACIRCGRCIRHCPLRLMPSHIVAAYEAGDMERLAELKVNLCMECGCCSFGCPAHRPLVQTNKLAKAKLAAWRKLQSEKIDAKKEAVQK